MCPYPESQGQDSSPTLTHSWNWRGEHQNSSLMLGLFPLENYYYFSSVSRPVITRVVECLNRIVRLAVVQLQIFECLWRIKYLKLMLDLISLMLRYLYLLDKHQLEVGFNPENSFRK